MSHGKGREPVAFRSQLLKWVGNKQRFAHEIIANFPRRYGTYFEPFLGSGAILGSLVPGRAVASDAFAPLIQIWQTLQSDPTTVKEWYAARWALIGKLGKRMAYEQVRAAYNLQPNGADLLFLSRSCYGGIVRFRKIDGHMSTPCGAHHPISPRAFSERVDVWHRRVHGVAFRHCDYIDAFATAKRGDLIYCDPPYAHSQSILYGAQAFSLPTLFRAIAACESRGVHVALSIDGPKKSGNKPSPLPIPPGLFQREVRVNCGRSMLRRFQMDGQSLEGEVVTDRLLLTY